MFLCWFLGQVLPFLWRASGGSRNLAMLVGTLGTSAAVCDGKRRGSEEAKTAKRPRPTTAITLTTTYWRRTEWIPLFVFFCFFWICKQWKPCWKRLFEIRTVIRFSFQELTKRRSRGWTWAWKVGSTDRLTVFFSVSLSICAVCGCEFISGGPSLVGFDPVTVLKNYYGQQLSGDLKIWFTIHNMIWFMYLMYLIFC